MPDITMCKGGKCPLKEKCLRFNSTPNPHRQSYFAKPPFEAKPDRNLWICDCFIYEREGE